MKIGPFDLREFAAKKPLTVTSAGEFVTAKEIMARPALGLGSLIMLDKAQQIKLTVARYALEPEFSLGVMGVGIYTKDEVIEHIENQTVLGSTLLHAEMNYCNEFIADLTADALADWPTLPNEPPTEIPNWRHVKHCVWLRLTNRVVFCENTLDPAVRPFALYREKHVHPVFQARCFNINVLDQANDTRANFVPLAENPLTVYLSGSGHGDYDRFKAYNPPPILQVGQYAADEVKDKSLHFLSCRTARDLGPDTIKHGAYSYTGYTEDFLFQSDNTVTPAVNEFELFARADSTYDIMMANGTTAQYAYNATIQAFNAACNQVPNTIAATLLTWNRDHFKLNGNSDAVIRPYRSVRICFPILQLEQEDALVKAGYLED